MRRFFLFLLTACLCLLPNFGVAKIKNPDTFIEIRASGGDLESLDPAYPYDVASFEILMNVYEPLIWNKGTSIKEFEPLLSEQVPTLENGLLSPDGKTYTFPVRQNVQFHDGTPLTCKDVRYSILRFMLQDRAGGPSSLMLEPIANLQGTRDKDGKLNVNIDDIFSRVACEGKNLKINLPKPYGPFLSIASQFSYAVSKKWAIAHGDWDGTKETWAQYNNPKPQNSYLFDHMNGTGPFMLERWERNLKEISLTRNEKYWRKPAALKRVIIKPVPEFSTRRLMIASGDADYIDEAGAQFESQLKDIPNITVLYPPRLRVEGFYFTFNVDATGNPALYSGKLDGNGIPPNFFTDKDLRKGFAYAFDYDGYIKDVLKGRATRPTGCIPHDMLGFNANQPVYSLNLEKAKEHFKRAWGGQVWEKGFRLAIYYDTNNESRHMPCEILKRNVESLNPKFKIDVRTLQWSSFMADIRKGRLPMFKLGWLADFADPHNFAFSFLHSEGQYPKEQGFAYPEWDKLVQQANYTPDPKAREAIYFKLQELAYEEVPQIYTDEPLSFKVFRTWVKGYVLNPIFPGLYYYPITKSES